MATAERFYQFADDTSTNIVDIASCIDVLPQRAFEECRELRCSILDHSINTNRIQAGLFGLYHQVLKELRLGHDATSAGEFHSSEKPTLQVLSYKRVSGFLHLPPRTKAALGIQAPRKVGYKAIGSHGLNSAAIDLPSLLDRCLSPGGRRLLTSQLLNPATDPDEINDALDMVQWVFDHLQSPHRTAGQQGGGNSFHWRADSSNIISKKLDALIPHMVGLGDVGKTMRKCTTSAQQSSPVIWKRLCSQLLSWQQSLSGLVELCSVAEQCPFTRIVENYGLSLDAISTINTEVVFLQQVLVLPESAGDAKAGMAANTVLQLGQAAALLPGYMDSTAIFVAQDASDELARLWAAFISLAAPVARAA